jgi:hypothetical protein
MDFRDKLLLVAERGAERFEIIVGCRGEGFYVYRYVDGVDTHDYLAQTVVGAQACAKELWSVSESAWYTAADEGTPRR